MFDIIDINQWKRKDLFRFFNDFDNPTWDLMCDVRVTSFYRAIKAKDYSFFLSFIYVGSLACNTIDELKCRIDRDGKVRQYHLIHPGSTILYEDETYGYGYFDFHHDFEKFMTIAKLDFDRQKKSKGVDPKEEDLARVYFSPVPWVSFTGFRHPYRKSGNTSIPMVVFGKYYERDGELFLPVGLTLHHGLADGFHAGKFFTTLQELLDQPENYLTVNK